jgi:porin
MMFVNCLLLVGCTLACFTASPALAVPPPMTMAVDADNPSLNEGSDAFGFMNGISKSGNMLGDMWGVRPWLGQYGITLGLQETSEVLGNVTGGYNKGFQYDGLTQLLVQMDTQRAFGWYGGTFNVSALQMHGRNLSADNLGTLQTASGIESDDKTRLWEAWYQQKFLDQDRMDIKVGQQSLDQEFIGSQNANYFVNTMFGWPMVPSADLPGGGPAYPLSAPGVRVRVKPTNSLTFLAGVFTGSPSPDNNNPDSQIANASGTNFRFNSGTLAIAEVQYSYPALGSMVSTDDAHPLSGTYKLGIWYDSENFADQQYDNTGQSLALTGGTPQPHRGDYSIYAVGDQMLWHSQYVDDRTLNFFTRIMGTPEINRNLIDFSLNAGFTLHEPIFGRDDDTFGVGLGYAKISPSVAAYDTALTTSGTYTPAQSSETFIEATYQAQITPWWQLQPDIQYVFNPGGGILDPNTGLKVGNELVLGIRTNILF